MIMSLEQKEIGPVILKSYELQDLNPPFKLLRPDNTIYYIAVDYPDPGIKSIREQKSLQDALSSRRIIEASLYAANDFIRHGSLEYLKKYYDSWKEIKSPQDMTPHEVKEIWGPASDGWGSDMRLEVFPDFYEYLAFNDDREIEEIKNNLKNLTLQNWFSKQKEWFGGDHIHYVWIGNLRVDGSNNKLQIGRKRVTSTEGRVSYEDQNQPITWADFEDLCRQFLEMS